VVERLTKTPSPDKFFPRGGNILTSEAFTKEAGVTIPAITPSDSLLGGQYCPANFPATVAGYGRGQEEDKAVFYQFGYVAPPVAPTAPTATPVAVPSTTPTVAPTAPTATPSVAPSTTPTTPITPSAKKGLFASATVGQKSIFAIIILAIVGVGAYFYKKTNKGGTSKGKK
jgi:hypothetical protein